MSTLELEHLKHTSSSGNNLSVHSDGSLTVGSLQSLNVIGNVGIGTSTPAKPLSVVKAGGGDFVAEFQNTTSGTPYNVHIKDAPSGANGYPLLTVSNSAGTGTYFRVDSGTGFVTKPNQPYFYAGGTANGNVSGGTIPFNSAAHNVGNHFNTSNYTFTAPITGKYLFTCSVLNYPGTQSGGEIYFSVNGGGYSPLARWYTITQQESITLSAIKLLSANDTVKVIGTLDYYVTSGHGHFSGMLLG